MLGGVGLGQMEGGGYFKKTTDGLISLSPCVTFVYYWGFFFIVYDPVRTFWINRRHHYVWRVSN